MDMDIVIIIRNEIKQRITNSLLMKRIHLIRTIDLDVRDIFLRISDDEVFEFLICCHNV